MENSSCVDRLHWGRKKSCLCLFHLLLLILENSAPVPFVLPPLLIDVSSFPLCLGRNLWSENDKAPGTPTLSPQQVLDISRERACVTRTIGTVSEESSCP